MRIDGREGEAHGVRIGRCRRFAGLALVSSRSFVIGEVAYESHIRLLPLDAEVWLDTDVGSFRLNPAIHGFVITPRFLRRASRPLLVALVRMHGLTLGEEGSHLLSSGRSPGS